MVLGAILGGIIAPICNQIIRRLFKDRKDIGLNSAILFLMCGNAAWIVGEATMQFIDILRDPSVSSAEFGNVRALAYLVNLLVYILAACSLYIAYEHIPSKKEGEKFSFIKLRKGPLAPFIIGNWLWVVGELFQIFFYYLSEELERPFIKLRYYPRLFTLGLALFYFSWAAIRAWKYNRTPDDDSKD
jgi:amino acid transporter